METFSSAVVPRLKTQWVELPDTPHCPTCKSTELARRGSFCTLTGGTCHNGYEYTCNNPEVVCTTRFTRHVYGGNDHRPESEQHVWYVVGVRVVEGYAGCFEDFLHLCKCGGMIRRKYLKEDSDEIAHSLSTTIVSNGPWIKHYRTFYECSGCDFKVQTSDDYCRGREE